MKLIVGLGNPGKEYSNTRHNIGFMVIDALATINNVSISKSKFGGLYGETNIDGEKVIFLKPQKYINLSGEVIKAYIDFFKIDIDDILIIHDDLDTEFGTYRLRAQGSSGGHNGLKNIELHLGTKIYNRIKIGISNNKELDTKDYVLGSLSQDEKKKMENTIDVMKKIFIDYFNMSFSNLMNKYNCK